MYQDALLNARNHILACLRETPTIRYSRFYDGTEETENALRKIVGLDDDSDEAEIFMDDAADQLKQAGFVELKDLEIELVDGNPDYEIILTEVGRQMLAQKE